MCFIMMTIRISLVAVLLFALLACNRNRDYTEASSISTDSFLLSDFHTGSLINYHPNDSDLLISHVSADGKKILFFSTAKRRYIDSVHFDQRDMDQQYYIDNNKTVYVYKTEQDVLLIRDSAGRERFLYKREEYIYDDRDTLRQTYEPICMPLQVIDSILVMNGAIDYYLADESDRKKYFSKPNMAALKVADDSVMNMGEFCHFPLFYRDNYISEDYPVATRVGSYVYYLFSNENRLFRYDIKSGVTDSFKIKGLDLNPEVPYNINGISSIATSNEYYMKSSSYLKLLCDAKTGQFVVFRMLPVKNKPEDGTLSLYFDKPMLLYFFDSTREVNKKIYFDDNTKFSLRFICYHNGKLFAPEHYSYDDEKSSIYVYSYDVK